MPRSAQDQVGWGANIPDAMDAVQVREDRRMISASVGRAGANRARDVELVQRLLRRHLIASGGAPLLMDGLVGPATIGAIEQFQRMGSGDSMVPGILKPGSADVARLVSRVARRGAVLRLSEKGKTLLRSIERLRLEPYDDQTGQPVSAWVPGATIGFGHLISAAEWPRYAQGISREAAELLFSRDLQPFEACVNRAVVVDLYPIEFDALLMLAFNIGQQALRTSSVVAILNDPSAKTAYPDLESAWKAWIRSQSKVSPGLVRRRACEWDIFAKGVYRQW